MYVILYKKCKWRNVWFFLPNKSPEIPCSINNKIIVNKLRCKAYPLCKYINNMSMFIGITVITVKINNNARMLVLIETPIKRKKGKKKRSNVIFFLNLRTDDT